MSTATYSNADALRNYIAEIKRTARAFAAALFAAQERQFVAPTASAKPALSGRALQKSRIQLFALARDMEHTSPSMSAELRNLASRG